MGAAKLIKNLPQDKREDLTQELKQYMQDLENGILPASGGWCKCCERWACGCGGPNHT